MGKYSEYSCQGYKVIDTIGNYTILKRDGDYCVAYLYDEDTGTWAQGFYMFDSVISCIDWLRESNRIEVEK